MWSLKDMPLAKIAEGHRVRWRKGSDCQLNKRKAARNVRRLKKLHRKQGRQ